LEAMLKDIPEEIGNKTLLNFRDTMQLKAELRNDSIQIGIFCSSKLRKEH